MAEGTLDGSTVLVLLIVVGMGAWVVRRDVQGRVSPQREPNSRYANLSAVSSALRTYGSVLKALAFVVAACGSMFIASRNGWLVMVGGVVVAVSLFGGGVLFAALGESLLALGDIATNTRRD